MLIADGIKVYKDMSGYTPPAPSGGNTGCYGSQGQYTAASSVGTIYEWSHNFVESISTSNTKTFDWTYVGLNNIRVAYYGGSLGAAKQVTVQQVPTTPGPIDGESYPYDSYLQTYYISSVSGATSYTWGYAAHEYDYICAPGWEPYPSSGGSTEECEFDCGAGYYCGEIKVRANNACGSSGWQYFVIDWDNTSYCE